MNRLTDSSPGRLLISCPDQPGIVSRVSSLLFSLGANIDESAQYTTDPRTGMFFMRLAFTLPGASDAADMEARVRDRFAPVAGEFSMRWQLSVASRRKRMAVFVSREDHCLLELLWQQRTGMLQVDIPYIISNHPDHEAIVRSMGFPYTHIPVSRTEKGEAEAAQLALVRDSVDFIALARYMQILSPQFIASFGRRIINIHHSFLPAFVGARPYERAYERGVKIIGATAHYVTEDLDAGPIIEQDVMRIHHGYSVAEMKSAGRQIERTVLARAVRWHIDDRILVHDNRTIVFT